MKKIEKENVINLVEISKPLSNVANGFYKDAEEYVMNLIEDEEKAELFIVYHLFEDIHLLDSIYEDDYKRFLEECEDSYNHYEDSELNFVDDLTKEQIFTLVDKISFYNYWLGKQRDAKEQAQELVERNNKQYIFVFDEVSDAYHEFEEDPSMENLEKVFDISKKVEKEKDRLINSFNNLDTKEERIEYIINDDKVFNNINEKEEIEKYFNPMKIELNINHVKDYINSNYDKKYKTYYM